MRKNPQEEKQQTNGRQAEANQKRGQAGSSLQIAVQRQFGRDIHFGAGEAQIGATGHKAQAIGDGIGLMQVQGLFVGAEVPDSDAGFAADLRLDGEAIDVVGHKEELAPGDGSGRPVEV